MASGGIRACEEGHAIEAIGQCHVGSCNKGWASLWLSSNRRTHKGRTSGIPTRHIHCTPLWKEGATDKVQQVYPRNASAWWQWSTNYIKINNGFRFILFFKQLIAMSPAWVYILIQTTVKPDSYTPFSLALFFIASIVWHLIVCNFFFTHNASVFF